MPREQVVNQLNKFFEDAQTFGLPPRDNGRHIRIDSAIGLSLSDILTSPLSPELKTLVALGLQTSQGVMMTKIVRHQPEGRERGQIVFELAGTNSRIGGELVALYDDRGNNDHLHVGPSLKMLTGGHFEVFEPFKNRPEDTQEQDALALVALARKAIGLEE